MAGEAATGCFFLLPFFPRVPRKRRDVQHLARSTSSHVCIAGRDGRLFRALQASQSSPAVMTAQRAVGVGGGVDGAAFGEGRSLLAGKQTHNLDHEWTI